LKFPLGSVARRVEYGIFHYPYYAYGLWWSAYLASRLQIPRISAIEFGVAGGRGLITLEKISTEIERVLGVGIDVVGFDTGEGLPQATDYRDLPHIWSKGFYKMDAAALSGRLRKARLILGDVSDTARQWFISGKEAPLGFIAFDLDYYSSTKSAFAVFEGSQDSRLPRVHCYFDDVAANDLGCMNPYVGELLAIQEFNETHATRKICKVEQLRLSRSRWEHWQEKIYVHHDFAHPLYTRSVIPLEAIHTQRPL
jgi:hypothetical protein